MPKTQGRLPFDVLVEKSQAWGTYFLKKKKKRLDAALECSFKPHHARGTYFYQNKKRLDAALRSRLRSSKKVLGSPLIQLGQCPGPGKCSARGSLGSDSSCGAGVKRGGRGGPPGRWLAAVAWFGFGKRMAGSLFVLGRGLVCVLIFGWG